MRDDAKLADPPHGVGRLSRGALASYGLFGLPLSLVALPIFVFVPKFYSDHFLLSLDAIGAILLVVRLLDAVSDPLFGWWVDHGRRATGPLWLRGYRRFVVAALPLLMAGYVALFEPLLGANPGAWAAAGWLAGALVVVYAGFSLANIAYYSWGADLTSLPSERTRITSAREGCGLIGVLVAAAMPQLLGMGFLSGFFVVATLLCAALLLQVAPHPPVIVTAAAAQAVSIASTLRVPLQNARFLRLLIIFLANGIASAIPATLVLFYIRDVLQSESATPALLGVYFLAGAASMPVWAGAARRFGLGRAWLAGMFGSVAVFVWCYFLGAGDALTFGAICILSGVAIGADLALPPALLAAVIAEAGQKGTREGAYFGLWNLATKLNLALAAGIALPLLSLMGYVPAQLSARGAHALSVGYAIVPCVLKLVAAALLARSSFVRGPRTI